MSKLRIVSYLLPAILTLSAIVTGGCSNAKETPAPASPPPPKEAAKPPSIRRGTITATPNPIKVCANAKPGKATITWEASGVKDVDVRIGAPDGALFGHGPLSGSWTTGEWVPSGQTFYLQDVSDGLPLTKENTLAFVIITHTKEGCK
jgi:hypothetical protein